MKKITSFLFLVFVVSATNAQLNEYKYIIIPKKLEGFKKENQYLTSTMLKYLFTEASYNATYGDMLPEDLKNRGCLGARADIEDKSSLFVTKINIVIKDCNNQIVFTSIEGRSKQKDYKAAYTEAIKKAFVSFEGLNYKYTPKDEDKKEESITLNFENDVKSIPNKEVTKSITKDKREINVIKQEATTKDQNFTSIEPVKSEMRNEDKTKKELENEELEIFYAQPIANGFQLVDSTPKIRCKLIETSIENVFLTTFEGENGVVLKKDSKWFFEYNKNGEKKLKELNIKF